MILVIGGAYQGKLDYVKNKYPEKSVYNCTNEEIDLSADVINSFHQAVMFRLRRGIDPVEYVKQNLTLLEDKIIICDDISCGVVPIDAEMRNWREAVGRCLNFLSSEADEVIRLFCGIGSRIK